MAYEGFRNELGPTQYPRAKTAVTADVTEAGFICAAIILFIAFMAILPGIRGLQNKHWMHTVVVELLKLGVERFAKLLTRIVPARSFISFFCQNSTRFNVLKLDI